MKRLRIVKFHHSQPVGGYSFVVDGTPLTGNNPRDVIKKISDYRATNSLPKGDPEHDLALSLKEKMPWLVREIETDDDPDPEGSEEHLCRDYVGGVWKTWPRPQEEADVQAKRFATCMACPHYQKLRVDFETCRKSSVLAWGLSGEIVDCSGHGFCEHHLWVCSVACSLKDNSEFANPEQDKQCWVKYPDEKNQS